MSTYPVHLIDASKDYQKLFLAYLLVFRDVLDGQKLADSLSELLEIGDWRKLGGRLRRNKDGALELHVPAQFTTAEPAIGFSQKAFDCNAQDHPFGRKLAYLSRDDLTNKVPADIAAFTGVPDIPRSVEEIMRRDGPQIYLHITVFADMTVVSIAWPHYLMDAVGLQALVQNWSLIVNGKVEHVVPLLGTHVDPITEAVDAETEPKEELLVEKLSLGPIAALMVGLRLIWDLLWAPKLEERLLALSPETMDRLCQRARQDVAKGEDQNAFVSEGDVLVGWAAQMLSRGQTKPRPVTVVDIVNARFRLSALQSKTAGCYVHNMLQFGYVCLPASCGREPLGQAALSHRRQLAAQITEKQMLGYFRMQQAQIAAKGKMRTMFGAAGSTLMAVNNLSKIDMFYAVDFSGAVIRRGATAIVTAGSSDTSRQSPPGTIVFYEPVPLHKQPPLVNFLRLIGRDREGTFLLEGVFRPDTWAEIVADLEQLEHEKKAEER